MRILICNWKDLAHPRAGGAEVWTHGVASAWAADGHDVTLACSSAPGLPARDERDGVGILRDGNYRQGVHAHARRVYEQFEGKFDLVLDEINTRPFAAPRWADRSRVVAFIHQLAREVWFRETMLPIALAGRYVLEPRWLRGYARVPVFTPSPSTADSLREYGIDHAIALPQGSDLPVEPRRDRVKDATPTFVFVGRMCSMKRPLDAIAAFRIVQQHVPAARLWMIGTGPDERTVQRHGGDGVEVLGAVTRHERDERMGRAHALIATSVREGWGLVVSEAAAQGTGAIAYAVPGLIDSVRASGGAVVAPTIGALADEMLRVAHNPASAPIPTGTGTVPFAEVASALLEGAEVSHRA
jgi:glycosyltransferase involved in cell wall biosynthesis